uniref:Putative extracellular protein CSOL_105 n=1 Tax=Pseudococcomyxa simplex TaxID=464287 RepID=A0A7L9QED2_9CHLO|nr:putative extracellular protein CSOL_105 [Pseudococcomyxa simplex]
MASRPSLLAGLVLAFLACSAFAEEQLPTADLLIPQNEADYSNLVSALMDQQHKVLTTTLGADHPQVALASTLVDLQTTVGSLMANLTADYANFVKFITTAPTFFNQLSADASLLNKQIVATIRAVSPNLANAIGPGIGAPAFFVNKPNTVTASQTLASVSEQLFSIAPCLIALSQTGVQVNPILIGVSPRLLQLDAVGVQVQPELITVDPTLINIAPNGVNASPTNVKASPTFIDVSPTVKVVPNSNKAPTISAGIAIKPNPDAPTITNEWGKVVATAPTPKLTPVNADGSPIKAAAAKAPATGRRL